MLNDLFAIERGMTAHGVDIVGRHPDLNDMARGPAFRVRLSSVGAIVGVDLVPDAGRGVLWTLRKGKHNGFPGLSIGREAQKSEPLAGLLTLDEQDREVHQQTWEGNKSAVSRRAELLRLISAAPLDANLSSGWLDPNYRKAIAQRLEALRSLTGDPLTAAVPAAFERFLLALAVSPPFAERLLAALSEAVRNRGDEWLEPVQAALLGPAALFIDVSDGDFDRDAGNEGQIGPVTAALSAQAREGGGAAAEQAVSCALSGRTGNLHSGNFPQPNLPGLGQTYIFARNKDIPSLTRYGHTADASFPIDFDLVCRLHGAIYALTREDAKGRSWRLIPAETGNRPDLLVTSLDAKLADALAGDEDDDAVDGQSAWNELGRRLINQTQGTDAGPSPLDEVSILILRTVDQGNRKAIYCRNTTSTEIWHAAQRWEKVATNLPDWIGFKLPVKGVRGAVFKKPPSIKPLSITPLSRVQFTNGGRRRVPVVGVTAADAFGLFLQEGDVEPRARKILRLLLQRHEGLLGGLAAARIKGDDHLKEFDPRTDLRRDALRSAAWIGVLLYELDHFKEVYMSDAGFRLGQLLAAVDMIHVGYCIDVRKGSIPATLIGNAVFSAAGSNPSRALSILQGRWAPYDAWTKDRADLEAKIRRIFDEARPLREKAQALKAGHKDDEAAKADRRAAEIEAPGRALCDALAQAAHFRELCPKLAADLAGEPVSDTFRAELLLGYMAGPPREKDESGKSRTDGENQNEGE